METKLLTISIAAYNVEKYLTQTLSSLDDDRFADNIEVLVIDDGSKDDTASIAKKYQEKRPNTFKYIQKPNGGHGSTINKGIELAKGRYFRVIDGDDWVDTESFCRYLEKLEGTDTDMVLTRHMMVSENDKRLVDIVHGLVPGEKYSLNEKLQIDNVTLHMLTVKTDLLKDNHVRITEKCFYVDVEYIIWAIFLSADVTYFEDVVYMYRVGNINQSISKRSMLKNIDMQRTVSQKLVILLKEFNREGLSTNKKGLLDRRVLNSVGATTRTYLLLDNYAESKKRIIEFDSVIKELNSDFYAETEKNFFYKVVRAGNYALLWFVRLAYLIWCKKYE